MKLRSREETKKGRPRSPNPEDQQLVKQYWFQQSTASGAVKLSNKTKLALDEIYQYNADKEQLIALSYEGFQQGNNLYESDLLSQQELFRNMTLVLQLKFILSYAYKTQVQTSDKLKILQNAHLYSLKVEGTTQPNGGEDTIVQEHQTWITPVQSMNIDVQNVIAQAEPIGQQNSMQEDSQVFTDFFQKISTFTDITQKNNYKKWTVGTFENDLVTQTYNINRFSEKRIQYLSQSGEQKILQWKNLPSEEKMDMNTLSEFLTKSDKKQYISTIMNQILYSRNWIGMDYSLINDRQNALNTTNLFGVIQEEIQTNQDNSSWNVLLDVTDTYKDMEINIALPVSSGNNPLNTVIVPDIRLLLQKNIEIYNSMKWFNTQGFFATMMKMNEIKIKFNNANKMQIWQKITVQDTSYNWGFVYEYKQKLKTKQLWLNPKIGWDLLSSTQWNEDRTISQPDIVIQVEDKQLNPGCVIKFKLRMYYQSKYGQSPRKYIEDNKLWEAFEKNRQQKYVNLRPKFFVGQLKILQLDVEGLVMSQQGILINEILAEQEQGIMVDFNLPKLVNNKMEQFILQVKYLLETNRNQEISTLVDRFYSQTVTFIPFLTNVAGSLLLKKKAITSLKSEQDTSNTQLVKIKVLIENLYNTVTAEVTPDPNKDTRLFLLNMLLSTNNQYSFTRSHIEVQESVRKLFHRLAPDELQQNTWKTRFERDYQLNPLNNFKRVRQMAPDQQTLLGVYNKRQRIEGTYM